MIVIHVMYDPEYQRKWRNSHKDYRKKWLKENSGKYRESRKNSFLKRKYGITIEEYNQLFSEQEGCCRICHRHQSEFKRSLAVDHSHETNKVRGLLCHHCNKGIGDFFEDVSVMEEAILYLKQSLR